MITKERIEEIQTIIKDNNLYDKSLNQIARENDIEVIFADLSTISDVPLSWSIGNFDWIYKIYIDSNSWVKRQYFTLAHELWHFFLHNHLLGNNSIIEDKKDEKYLFRPSIYSNTIPEMKGIEEEANEFAWMLLMPESTVRELVNVIGISIPILAGYFKVSSAAMKYRLYKLGIIENYGE